MRQLTVRLAILWTLVLSMAAFARVHFRSVTTGVAYDLGQLKTQEGKRLYAKRKSTVEPVFGIIKHVMGFRQFMLRGAKKVKSEWDLVAICWNIKRLHAIKTNMA